MRKRLIVLGLLFFAFLMVQGAYLHWHQVKMTSVRNPASVGGRVLQTIIGDVKTYRKNGLIAQYNGDMGDTLQRTGSYYTMLKYLEAEQDDLQRPLIEGYNQDLNQLSVRTGYFRRSNREGDWSSNPENCSRDQMMALHSAIVVYSDAVRGRAVFNEFLSRLMFNQNIRHNDAYPGENDYSWKFPDPPSPMQLSLMLRGLHEWWVYPAVFALDMALILDMTILRRLDSRQLWDTDIKAVPTIIAANSYLPTPWSKLALILYVDQGRDIENRVRHYNDVSLNGIPPLADLYVFSVSKLQKPQTDYQLALMNLNSNETSP